MKPLKSYIAYSLFILPLLLLVACDRGFEALNENPNAPTDAPPAQYLLPTAIHNSMDRLYEMDGLNGYVGAIWSQQYAKIQYTEEDFYDFSGRVTLVNSIWADFYSNGLNDLNQMRLQARENEDQNTEAIATILMSWNFQMLTDTWGDVPYSEALQGPENTSPAYDEQREIYNGVLSDLENAANSIETGTNPLGGADLIYGGDMGKWQKLANSLRLRMYMRLSQVEPATAEAGIRDIIDNGAPIMESHEDNAQLNYLASPSNNPVNEFARTREDHKVSRTMISHLDELNDPRLRIYSVPVRSQDAVDPVSEFVVTDDRGLLHQGVRNGDDHLSIPLNQTSTMGHYFVAPRSPGRIMTYSEVLFIRAEAAARGWSNENADEMYERAVESALNLYNQSRLNAVLNDFPGDIAFNHQGFNADEFPEGITEDEITTYLSQNNVQWNTGEGWSENNQRLLATQKWLALYGQGLESWFEWRRLGYPEIQPGPNSVLSEVPTRLTYPVIEQSLNSGNRNAAVARQGADELTTRVWWDAD